jgi:hypothetical protein
MNPTEELNLRQVSLFKNVLHAILEGLAKSGMEFQPLAVATAAEEFAQEIRNQSAQDFKDDLHIEYFYREPPIEDKNDHRGYPDFIG